MEREQLCFRKKIIFADSITALENEREEFWKKVNSLFESGEKDRAIKWVEDMYIDLQSFLTAWKLDRWYNPSKKKEFVEACRKFLTVNSDETLQSADKEVEDIGNCNLMKVTKASLEGRFNVYWGHDQCDEIDYSLRRGACFTTSNPGKVNAFRKNNPKEWAEMLAEAKTEFPDADAVKLVSVMTLKVVAMMARYTSPIYDATDGHYGFSSIQVSPKNWDNAKAMEDEICFWYELFIKELKTDTPNITFKVPATPAAVIAAKAVNEKYARIRLCATSNFSTRQHIEFYDVLKNRDPVTLLVIVDVHLRTFAKPEFEAMGVDVEKYNRLLVSMIYRRCYRQLRENNLNIEINGAGIRDSEGVKNNYTDDMALPTNLTIMTGVVKDCNIHPQPIVDAMHDEISPEDLAVLDKCSIFRQAYYPDEFPWNDIRSFPPYKLMMDKFEEAYDENVEVMANMLKEA